eukprot:jgi/Bigna1/133433/aug1.21_g8141
MRVHPVSPTPIEMKSFGGDSLTATFQNEGINESLYCDSKEKIVENTAENSELFHDDDPPDSVQFGCHPPIPYPRVANTELIDKMTLMMKNNECSNLALFGMCILICQKEVENSGFTKVGNFLRCVMLFNTFVHLYYLYDYYSLSHHLLSLSEVFMASLAFWQTYELFYFLIEVIVTLVIDYPFVNYYIDNTLEERGSYGADDLQSQSHKIKNVFSLIGLCRMYLLFRAIKHRFYRPGLKIVGHWFDFSFNQSFLIRNLITWHPISLLVSLYAYFTFSLAYCLFYCEREVNAHLAYYTPCVYLTVITGFTVGYGDISPVTPFGRFVAMMIILFYAIMNAILVATIVRMLTNLKPYEAKMIEFMDNVDAHRLQKHYAANVLTALVRLRAAQVRKRNWAYIAYLKSCVIRQTQQFRHYKQKKKNRTKDLQGPQITLNIVEEISKSMYHLKKKINAIKPDLLNPLSPMASPAIKESKRNESKKKRKKIRVPSQIRRMSTILQRHKSIESGFEMDSKKASPLKFKRAHTHTGLAAETQPDNLGSSPRFNFKKLNFSQTQQDLSCTVTAIDGSNNIQFCEPPNKDGGSKENVQGLRILTSGPKIVVPVRGPPSELQSLNVPVSASRVTEEETLIDNNRLAFMLEKVVLKLDALDNKVHDVLQDVRRVSHRVDSLELVVRKNISDGNLKKRGGRSNESKGTKSSTTTVANGSGVDSSILGQPVPSRKENKLPKLKKNGRQPDRGTVVSQNNNEEKSLNDQGIPTTKGNSSATS